MDHLLNLDSWKMDFGTCSIMILSILQLRLTEPLSNTCLL